MAKAAVGLLLALALACGAAVLVHSGDEVYAVPGWGVSATIALMAAVVAGCALILRSGQPRFGAIMTAAVAFALLGLLAILSVGVVALAAAAILATWGFRRAPSRPGAAAAGALLAGLALPVLAAFAFAGPVVECQEDGDVSGENVFLALSGLGGSGESRGGSGEAAGGRTRGRASGDGYSYTYTCDGDRLVEFELRWR